MDPWIHGSAAGAAAGAAASAATVQSGHVSKVDPVSTKVPCRPLCFPRPKRFDEKRYLLDLSNCDGFDMLPKSLL